MNVVVAVVGLLGELTFGCLFTHWSGRSIQFEVHLHFTREVELIMISSTGLMSVSPIYGVRLLTFSYRAVAASAARVAFTSFTKTSMLKTKHGLSYT